MILADSNLIIYSASGKYPSLASWFEVNRPAVSAISLVEVLGYHKFKGEERETLQAFFEDIIILYPTKEIFKTAVELRQQRSLSIGDAIIAATAICHNLTLATHNTDDFKWIETLNLSDPLVV